MCVPTIVSSSTIMVATFDLDIYISTSIWISHTNALFNKSLWFQCIRRYMNSIAIYMPCVFWDNKHGAEVGAMVTRSAQRTCSVGSAHGTGWENRVGMVDILRVDCSKLLFLLGWLWLVFKAWDCCLVLKSYIPKLIFVWQYRLSQPQRIGKQVLPGLVKSSSMYFFLRLKVVRSPLAALECFIPKNSS